MFHNVCRLCLGTEELIWIFNEKMADNMPEIIEVTSGVQITKSDTVTQMVCSTCCQITIKMYKFRTTSIKNDKDLKARCAGYNISQIRNSLVQTKQELAAATTVAASDNINSSGSSTATNAAVSSSISAAPTLPVPKFQIPQKYKSAHPSIKQILKENPNIQLPDVSMKSHFGAYITLLSDEVDDWYKEKNYTDSEIVEIKQSAVKYATEFENPTPKPQRKRRRKSSIESASSSSSKSSSSKKLAVDKSVSESAKHKWKRIKLNSDLPKSNADTTKPNTATADKVRDSSVIKPTVPKMVISMTRSSVSPADKTNAQTTSKPSVHAKVQLDSNSNSNTKLSANVNTSVKADSTPKSSANVTSKSGASDNSNSANKVESKVRSTTPTVGTEWLSKGSVKPADGTKSTESGILQSILRAEDPPRNRRADITLTSILGTKDRSKRTYTELVSDSDGDDAGDDPSYEPEATDDASDRASDAEVIEIDEPGKKTERSLRKKSDQPQNRTKPKDEYTLFTTRPFVRNATTPRQKSDPRTQNCENAELFILSDSDDDDRTDANQSSNKNADNGSDNSDPIIVDIDSSETSSVQSSKEHSDQTKSTNMPDLSLVSLTHKSNTLFICKVCDGHYHSLKDLKVHERRTHTKCPFCNKKFRSLASRDEHVKYTCIINNAPFELKNPKLELIRVDEIEEIRKQYASAFEEMLDYASESNPSESGAEDTTPATVSEEVPGQSVALPPPPPPPPQQPQQQQPEQQQQQPQQQLQQPQQQQPQQQPVEKTDDRRRQDEETTDAVSEFEKFLRAATSRSTSEQTTNSTEGTGSSSSSEAPAAESVEVTTSGTSSNNGDIICISDDEADTSSPIKPKSKPKIKIINNDILKSINLHDSDANVLKNILTRARLHKSGRKTVSIDALKNYSILDGGTSRVKVFKDLRKHLQHYKIPIEIQYNPNLNVEYKYAAVPPTRKTTDIWSKMVPHDLKLPVQPKPPTQPPTQPSKPPPSYNAAVSALSPQQVKNTSLILRTQPSSTPQIMTSTSNIFNTAVSQNPGFVTMAQVASVVSSSSIVSAANNLVFSSQPSALVTSSVNDHCYSTPMVLNGAPSICTTNTTNNITNFILVSGALVPTADKISNASLPAAQGPLPIIQYVTSGVQEAREPLTITEVPSPPPTSSAPAPPAIRVKNLSELS